MYLLYMHEKVNKQISVNSRRIIQSQSDEQKKNCCLQTSTSANRCLYLVACMQIFRNSIEHSVCSRRCGCCCLHCDWYSKYFALYNNVQCITPSFHIIRMSEKLIDGQKVFSRNLVGMAEVHRVYVWEIWIY